jgi:hypothetical protein
MWPAGCCARSDEPRLKMRAESFDKLRAHFYTLRTHSSIVHLIFIGSVSGAIQVDATVWFARSVIGQERPQQRDMEVGGLYG